MDSIVTLTMNPALDITVAADAVRPTDKIRCARARYDAGGGGINVAKTAHVLGAPVSAVFPAGGATGDMLTRFRRRGGVPVSAVDIAGPRGRASRSMRPAPGCSTGSSSQARG